MARFHRSPVFAWVISLLIVLAGVLSLRALPVAQYPDIAPRRQRGRQLSGASAKVVEEAVTAIIEREMNGAPGLLYTTASSDSTGWASINLVFKQGTNPDLAAVEVQNRLKAVEPRLPGGRAPRRRARGEGRRQHPAGGVAEVRRPPGRHAARRAGGVQRAAGPAPRRRRGQGAAVGRGSRHAHLARPGQADGHVAHAGRHRQRAARTTPASPSATWAARPCRPARR